jgi:hypothetical protein
VIDFLHLARLVFLEAGQFASKTGGGRQNEGAVCFDRNGLQLTQLDHGGSSREIESHLIKSDPGVIGNRCESDRRDHLSIVAGDERYADFALAVQAGG